jgi:hypothetical protein
MNSLDSMLQRCDELAVACSKFTESVGLSLKKFSDGLNRVAALELDGEWMSNEVYARLFSILLQSGIKKRFEDISFRGGSQLAMYQ